MRLILIRIGRLAGVGCQRRESFEKWGGGEKAKGLLVHSNVYVKRHEKNSA